MSDQRSDRARFQDRVMIVTGAAQGIGRRVAERAAAEGACLVLVDRSDYIHDVVAEISQGGSQVMAVQADLEPGQVLSRQCRRLSTSLGVLIF